MIRERLKIHAALLKIGLKKYHGIVLESEIDLEEKALHRTQQLSWALHFPEKPPISAVVDIAGHKSLGSARMKLRELIAGEIVKSQDDKARKPTSI